MDYKKKLFDWFGNLKDKDYREIYSNNNEAIFIVKDGDNINFARIFRLGDRLEISIDNIVSDKVDIIIILERFMKQLIDVL